MGIVGSTSTSDGAISTLSLISVLMPINNLKIQINITRLIFPRFVLGKGMERDTIFNREKINEIEPQPCSVRDSFPQSSVQRGMLIYDTVIPDASVKMDKSWSKSW